jgi:hypothetical protein
MSWPRSGRLLVLTGMQDVAPVPEADREVVTTLFQTIGLCLSRQFFFLLVRNLVSGRRFGWVLSEH